MANYNSTHTGQIIDATISAVIAGKAGIQGVKVNGTEITPDSSTNKVDINIPSAPTVVQTTGTSTSNVMSQNAVTTQLGSKADSSSLSTVATSGSYNDLLNKPTIPTVVQTTGTSKTDVMSQDAVTTQLSTKANSSSLAAVATSGSYNDLSDKPSAPNVVQTTGSSTTEVMSQKATTDALGLKADSSSLAAVATSGSYNDLSDKPSAPNVVQITGTSTTEVMSQKATTDALGLKADLSSLAAVATSGSYNDLSDKPSAPNVVQTTGSSTTEVMSQNAVTTQLNSKADSSSLSTVATSGSYNDLSNKPSVPTVVQVTGTSTTDVMSQDAVTTQLSTKANSSSLSTVATSGSYNDLSDKPTVPTIVQTTGTSTTNVMSQDAVTIELSSKVDNVSGKGLSTNDFTNTYKTKLDGIESNATRTIINSYSIVLTAANWSSTAPYTYTVNNSDITSSDEAIFDIELSSNTSTAISELESWGYVSKADTSNGQITFTCLETKPTVNLPVKMLVIKFS